MSNHVVLNEDGWSFVLLMSSDCTEFVTSVFYNPAIYRLRPSPISPLMSQKELETDIKCKLQLVNKSNLSEFIDEPLNFLYPTILTESNSRHHRTHNTFLPDDVNRLIHPE